MAIYPAHRDAKAALRWVVAHADIYNINPDYITVGGGSAGAITSIGIGVSEPGDYRDELGHDEDPTLLTTHLEVEFEVRTVLDFWGSKISIDALAFVYGLQRFDAERFPQPHGDTAASARVRNELEAVRRFVDDSVPPELRR